MASSTGGNSEGESQHLEAVKVYKMVVIGETGSGKTSLIQLLLNYSKQFDQEFDLKAVNPSVENSSQAVEKKEWESDTTKSTKYSAVFGDFHLDIIDTPGFADTRGEEQEKLNIANIIETVKKEFYISCVCIVFNGTQTRLTEVLGKVLSAIVSILPSDVINNVIVVFTKVQDELSLKFKPKLFEDYQLRIPEDYRFIMDNPYSRYESAPSDISTKQQKRLKRDFKDAHETLDEMFSVVQKLKPVATIHFGEFQEITQDIQDSFSILQVHHANKKALINLFGSADLEGSKNKRVKYPKVHYIKSESINISCKKCMDNCHMKCDCWFTFFSIRACSSFSWGTCKKCHHSSGDHEKSYYYYKIVDKEMLLTDLDLNERKKALQKELAPYDNDIKIDTEELKFKLQKFQSIGSNFIFSKRAMHSIDSFKKEMERFPEYKSKKDIVTILDAILAVISNPEAVESNEKKFQWACAALGVDPNNATEANIQRLFHQKSKDTTDESSKSCIHHAKEYLMRRKKGK